MKIIDIVKRLNARLKYDNYTYDELQLALDAAIDKFNTEWRVHVPLISDYPELTDKSKATNRDEDKGKLIATHYEFLPDEIIRMFIIPYAAGYQYILSDVDGTVEMQEAMTNLASLSPRYQIMATPGAQSLGHINYDILSEDYSDQFANGHDNYGYEEGIEGSSLNPLNQ